MVSVGVEDKHEPIIHQLTSSLIRGCHVHGPQTAVQGALENRLPLGIASNLRLPVFAFMEGTPTVYSTGSKPVTQSDTQAEMLKPRDGIFPDV